MIIRKIRNEDIAILADLFFQTVRRVNIRDYSQAQVEAWAPQNRDMEKWQQSFRDKIVFVAEENSKLIGFGELETSGHIDRFYIDADWIGKGVGRQIYGVIESEAFARKSMRLFVEASITAKPFFKRMGFAVIREQTVNVRGTLMQNFFMEKHLKVS